MAAKCKADIVWASQALTSTSLYTSNASKHSERFCDLLRTIVCMGHMES